MFSVALRRKRSENKSNVNSISGRGAAHTEKLVPAPQVVEQCTRNKRLMVQFLCLSDQSGVWWCIPPTFLQVYVCLLAGLVCYHCCFSWVVLKQFFFHLIIKNIKSYSLIEKNHLVFRSFVPNWERKNTEKKHWQTSFEIFAQ